MIEAIIFDWFGVCTEKWIDVWERELRLKNPDIDAIVLRKTFFQHLDSYAVNKIKGNEFLQMVLGSVGLKPDEYVSLLTNQGTVNREMLDLILRLRKNYRTAILSDNFNEIVPVIEAEIGGFGKYFDVISLSNRLKVGKTDERISRLTIKELGVDPGNIIFVDDKEKNLKILRDLGVNTILYEFSRYKANMEQLKMDFASYGVKIPTD